MNRRIGPIVIAGVAIVVILFVVFETWVSSAEQIRSQRELLGDLKVQLDAGAQGGGASAVKLGGPVGLLEAKRAGIEQVIVQGTGSQRLKRGPGHESNTPLPGAKGVAVIEGHRTTYGAPFRHLDRLRPGDDIVITTSLGRTRFNVVDEDAPHSTSELVLRTSDRVLHGVPFEVRAKLDGEPLIGGLSSAKAKSSTSNALAFPLMLIEAALLMGAALVTARAYRRFHPRATFVLSAPVILALLFVLFGTADRFLPGTL